MRACVCAQARALVRSCASACARAHAQRALQEQSAQRARCALGGGRSMSLLEVAAVGVQQPLAALPVMGRVDIAARDKRKGLHSQLAWPMTPCSSECRCCRFRSPRSSSVAWPNPRKSSASAALCDADVL